jgi:hypothetical protein
MAEPGSQHRRGTFDRVLQEHSVIDGDSSRAGRWLRQRRIRIALWLAVFEGIVVAIKGESKWVVAIIAALVLVIYASLRDRLNWDAGRQVLWIVAASQVLALLVAIFAFILESIAVILVVIIAVAALVYLFADLRKH